MKKQSSTFIGTLTKDKTILSLVIVNLVIALIVSISIATTVQPSEVQVVTQYTSYGVTNFYRSHWYSILFYIGLQLAVFVGHTALSAKLININRRPLAVALLSMTIGLSVMIYLFAMSIIKIAALG